VMVKGGLRAASEAVFGSAARGDADRISDRDYLIVDSDTDVLKTRSLDLIQDGWSVASYTFAKLSALSKHGALFVQHLKNESLITVDKNDQLRQLLHSFSPKESYQAEIRENALLASLIKTRPESSRGGLWAADVLYVTVRNFGVLSLAEKRKFTFSYSDIIDELIAEGMVHKKAHSALLNLRFLKSLYRSGENFSSNKIEQTVSAALKELPFGAFPSESTPISPKKILTKAQCAPLDSSSYYRLRNLEKCFLAASALDGAFVHSGLAKEMLKWIENPRAYAFVSALVEPNRISELKSVAQCHENCPRTIQSANG
jgi:hypothetical protein